MTVRSNLIAILLGIFVLPLSVQARTIAVEDPKNSALFDSTEETADSAKKDLADQDDQSADASDTDEDETVEDEVRDLSAESFDSQSLFGEDGYSLNDPEQFREALAEMERRLEEDPEFKAAAEAFELQMQDPEKRQEMEEMMAKMFEGFGGLENMGDLGDIDVQAPAA